MSNVSPKIGDHVKVKQWFWSEPGPDVYAVVRALDDEKVEGKPIRATDLIDDTDIYLAPEDFDVVSREKHP